MSVTLSYSRNIETFKKAVKKANEIMQSEEFYTLITGRENPFDESEPASLSPAAIADLFRNSNLSLEVKEYEKHPTIGGAFDPRYKNNVYLNTKAVGRGFCSLACVLVHECVHALSYHTQNPTFSHCTEDEHTPKDHEDTAPFWIQSQLSDQHNCSSQKENDLLPDDLLIVELSVDSEGE